MKNDALKFLRELSCIIGTAYDSAVEAVCAIRSMGAYEDSGLYHVNIKGAGSFAFKVIKLEEWQGGKYSVIMVMAYPEDLDE